MEGGSFSRFYYYLDMVRPTDRTTDTENRICYSRIPGGGGGMPHHREPQGEGPHLSGGREVGPLWATAFIVVSLRRN